LVDENINGIGWPISLRDSRRLKSPLHLAPEQYEMGFIRDVRQALPNRIWTEVHFAQLERSTIQFSGDDLLVGYDGIR
jgi:hypothetical protein